MIRRGELVHLMWDDIRETADGEYEILIHRKEWDETVDVRSRLGQPEFLLGEGLLPRRRGLQQQPLSPSLPFP